jgi:hypothetical protein
MQPHRLLIGDIVRVRVSHEMDEPDDDPDRARAVLCRLHELVTASRVALLVTDGIDADLAQRLA